MHNVRTVIADRRARARLALRAAFAIGCAALVCGCTTDQQIAGSPSVPTDYRLRHPITITEKDRTFQLFIGANRGSLTPPQRAELLAFAQSWKDAATGGVIIDLPVGSSNERSSADALREIESILAVDRRAAAEHGRAQLPGLGPYAGHRAHQLSADCRASRTMRAMAEGHRAELQPRLFRKSAVVELRLRHPTQSCGDGRRSGRPGAAASRNAGLHHAAHDGPGEISPGSVRVDYTRKYHSDVRQDHRHRAMMMGTDATS